MTPSLSELSAPASTSASASASASAAQSVGQSHHSESNSKTAAASEYDFHDSTQNSDEFDRPQSITSPQLFTSPSIASDESHLPDSSSKDGISMVTPPLETGETRLHPLIDEHRSMESSSILKQTPHALLEAQNQEASNQYPSPSSGFVPPVTEDDFVLDDISTKKKRNEPEGPASDSSTSAIKASQGKVTVDETELYTSIAEKNKSTSQKGSKSISVQSLTPALAIPRRMSTSSSSSSIGDNYSQAISARSSPSTVAPKRRASSTSQIYGESTLSLVDETARQYIPVKIRDYAFPEMDPRHVGAKDVSAPSPRESHLEEEQLKQHHGESETEEDQEEAFQEQGLPIGLYNAAYEFVAESEHELGVQVGQKLRLIGHVEGGWAIVVRVKEGQEDVSFVDDDDIPSIDKGLVPEAYLEWAGPASTSSE